jgi:hypothetical protein
MVWTRRRFLGGLGMAAGSACLLPSMARAQGGFQPRRFVFVVEGNSIEPVNVLSDQALAALGADRSERFNFYRDYSHGEPIVLQNDPLVSGQVNGAFMDSVNALDPLSGGPNGASIVDQCTVVLGLSSKVTGGGHSANFGALSSTRSSASIPSGETIDSVLARHLQHVAPFDAIRLGVTANMDTHLTYHLCAFQRGRAAPVMNNPVSAYGEIFGAFVDDEAARAQFAKRTRLLNFAQSHFGTVFGTPEARNYVLNQRTLPGRARDKLERYSQSIGTLQDRQGRLESMRMGLGMIDPASLPPQPIGSTDPLVRLEEQFSLAKSALSAGLTNVVVLASGTGNGTFNINYQGGGLPELGPVVGQTIMQEGLPRHDLQHGSSDNPGYVHLIRSATRKHVSLVYDLATHLKAQPEGGGSMLDNTLIVYMSDNGEQHHSTASDWPLLLVGGRNMGFNLGSNGEMPTAGRTVIYPGVGRVQDGQANGHREMYNFFNTILEGAGISTPVAGFGAGSFLVPGGLTELVRFV